jgi:2-polyprenyl-3-methyl-5-hydroxy-6-metoxy-1,4-benzoquinol methylase
MTDIYRKFYETVGAHYPEDEITYATISGLLRKKWIHSKMKILKSGNLLDCGCNVGRLSAPWHRGAVFGIDISYAVLKRGTQLFPSTSFIHGDLRSMSFIRAQSIDNAIACEVVEHLDQPEVFLRVLHRLLKPQARALITVPGYTQERVEYIPLGIMKSYGITRGTRGNMYLHHAYKPHELVALVKRTGFQVLESGSFEIELRLWQKPLTLIENMFYALSARLCPDSHLNRLFRKTMDQIKIDTFFILDTLGLSIILKKIFKEGRRSFVLVRK